MVIILLENYSRDRQESMLRFADRLADLFMQSGVVIRRWKPPVFFGLPFSQTNSGPGKWMGYLDKWLLFPLVILLRRALLTERAVRFHICDHSNAPYLKFVPIGSTVITCHDVIAIQSGLGYEGTHVTTSAMGRVLQKWILHHLGRSEKLATVSQYTMNELKALIPTKALTPDWRIIPNTLTANWYKTTAAEAEPLLGKYGLGINESFLLHMGSDLPRKNRSLLLDMVERLGDDFTGKICFAGSPPDAALENRARELNLFSRMISVPKPDHQTLVALYSYCSALVFPSYSEGFGLPIIEAQACGAAVITSSCQPMPEVGGEGALYADPGDAAQFADAYRLLKDPALRESLIAKGYRNKERFQPQKIIHAYLQLHNIEPNVA